MTQVGVLFGCGQNIHGDSWFTWRLSQPGKPSYFPFAGTPMAQVLRVLALPRDVGGRWQDISPPAARNAPVFVGTVHLSKTHKEKLMPDFHPERFLMWVRGNKYMIWNHTLTEVIPSLYQASLDFPFC